MMIICIIYLNTPCIFRVRQKHDCFNIQRN